MKKNEKEKQMLYDWGLQNNLQYHFPIIEKEKNSYFIKREGDSDRHLYIREYGFEVLPELMKELDLLWENDAVMGSAKKIVGVAAMKNKALEHTMKQDNDDKAAIEESIKESDDKEKLPMYIYNF